MSLDLDAFRSLPARELALSRTVATTVVMSHANLKNCREVILPSSTLS